MDDQSKEIAMYYQKLVKSHKKALTRVERSDQMSPLYEIYIKELNKVGDSLIDFQQQYNSFIVFKRKNDKYGKFSVDFYRDFISGRINRAKDNKNNMENTGLCGKNILKNKSCASQVVNMNANSPVLNRNVTFNGSQENMLPELNALDIPNQMCQGGPANGIITKQPQLINENTLINNICSQNNIPDVRHKNRQLNIDTSATKRITIGVINKNNIEMIPDGRSMLTSRRSRLNSVKSYNIPMHESSIDQEHVNSWNNGNLIAYENRKISGNQIFPIDKHRREDIVSKNKNINIHSANNDIKANKSPSNGHDREIKYQVNQEIFLCKSSAVTSGNISKFVNELDKIELGNIKEVRAKNERKNSFNDIHKNGPIRQGYTDLKSNGDAKILDQSNKNGKLVILDNEESHERYKYRETMNMAHLSPEILNPKSCTPSQKNETYPEMEKVYNSNINSNTYVLNNLDPGSFPLNTRNFHNKPNSDSEHIEDQLNHQKFMSGSSFNEKNHVERFPPCQGNFYEKNVPPEHMEMTINRGHDLHNLPYDAQLGKNMQLEGIPENVGEIPLHSYQERKFGTRPRFMIYEDDDNLKPNEQLKPPRKKRGRKPKNISTLKNIYGNIYMPDDVQLRAQNSYLVRNGPLDETHNTAPDKNTLIPNIDNYQSLSYQERTSSIFDSSEPNIDEKESDIDEKVVNDNVLKEADLFVDNVLANASFLAAHKIDKKLSVDDLKGIIECVYNFYLPDDEFQEHNDINPIEETNADESEVNENT